MRDIADAGETVAAIAVVADDLTGAADTGAAFAGVGLSTLVSWDGNDLGRAVRMADALAIDAGTRAADTGSAAGATGAIVRTLRDAGVAAIYKKGDSLLRGHIGAETAAVLENWRQGSVAIAAFAFPDAGRTTVRGRQYVRSASTGEAIPPLFEHASLRTDVIELDTVRGDALDARVRDTAGRCSVIVCDAATNADLARIVRAGQALSRPVVWVGAGGLARAIAASMRGSTAGARKSARMVRRGPVMIVCGSVSSVAREQVDRVIAAGAAPFEVAATVLREGVDGAGRLAAADAIRQALDRAYDVIVFSTAPAREMDPAVARGLGDLVSPLSTRVGAAVLTGGDTARAVLSAWRVTGLRIVDEIEPGVPVSLSEGETRLAVVTKAGAFGSADVLAKARERLHDTLKQSRD